MRYLFPALLIICLFPLTSPAISFEWEDPFCDNPDWTSEPSPLEFRSAGTGLPTALNLLIGNNFALPLDDSTSLAFNYGLFGQVEQNLKHGGNLPGPSFSVGFRCMFD